jgi:hypothetical protein
MVSSTSAAWALQIVSNAGKSDKQQFETLEDARAKSQTAGAMQMWLILQK